MSYYKKTKLTENERCFWNIHYEPVIVQGVGIRILPLGGGLQLSLFLYSLGYLEIYLELFLRNCTSHTDNSLHC